MNYRPWRLSDGKSSNNNTTISRTNYTYQQNPGANPSFHSSSPTIMESNRHPGYPPLSPTAQHQQDPTMQTENIFPRNVDHGHQHQQHYISSPVPYNSSDPHNPQHFPTQIAAAGPVGFTPNLIPNHRNRQSTYTQPVQRPSVHLSIYNDDVDEDDDEDSAEPFSAHSGGSMDMSGSINLASSSNQIQNSIDAKNEVRRQRHQQSEKRRRSKINDAINSARTILPGYPEQGTAAAKASIIIDCVRYIDVLENAMDENGIPYPMFYPTKAPNAFDMRGYQKQNRYDYGPPCKTCNRPVPFPKVTSLDSHMNAPTPLPDNGSLMSAPKRGPSTTTPVPSYAAYPSPPSDIQPLYPSNRAEPSWERSSNTTPVVHSQAPKNTRAYPYPQEHQIGPSDTQETLPNNMPVYASNEPFPNYNTRVTPSSNTLQSRYTQQHTSL